jgi:hypothetical protein
VLFFVLLGRYVEIVVKPRPGQQGRPRVLVGPYWTIFATG